MLTKVRLVKAMVSPVVMYGCESWTVKKAECQRIDAFELWCWRSAMVSGCHLGFGSSSGGLGWEDPLEEGMATHSSVLAWRIPWTEDPGRLQSRHELELVPKS